MTGSRADRARRDPAGDLDERSQAHQRVMPGHRAVVDGAARSTLVVADEPVRQSPARVVTAAAAIMMTVFAALVLQDAVFLKIAGLGLANACSLTPPWSAWCWGPPRWSCSATATAGCPDGSAALPRARSRRGRRHLRRARREPPRAGPRLEPAQRTSTGPASTRDGARQIWSVPQDHASALTRRESRPQAGRPPSSPPTDVRSRLRGRASCSRRGSKLSR